MSLLALALMLGSAQDVPQSKTCADGAVVLASDSCPRPAAPRRGRCELRAGQAPALHDVWLFELKDKILSAGPAGDAGKYLGVLSDRSEDVLQGTLVAQGGGQVMFALATESATIDGSAGNEAAIVPLDAAGKPARMPSR